MISSTLFLFSLREQYTAYRDVCTVLNLVAESNRHTLTEDYIEIDTQTMPSNKAA